jgi:tRNA(His) guanylyltransferase
MSELVLESNIENLSIIEPDSKPDSKPNEKLGDRMKRYEADFDLRVCPYESFIVRLDGRSFSKFTKKFTKPFDIVFVKAMCKTMVDLVEKFDIQTGYTHSDEITLIFNSKCSKELFDLFLLGQVEKNDLKIHLFDGRIQKILTLLSSFCSVRFNYHLDKLVSLIPDKYNGDFVNLIKSHMQMFDARMLKFDETIKYEILNHQIWRSIHDCERNAISTYAYTHFGPNKIMSKNCTDMIKMLEEKNIFWQTDVPIFIKHGIYCKKILVEKDIGENKVLRSEYICKQFKINFSDDNLSMLLDKYWLNSDGRLDIDNLTL